MGVGLLLALLYIFYLRKSSPMIRTLLFFPLIMPTVAVAELYSKMFAIQPVYGLVNSVLAALHLNALIQPWLGQGLPGPVARKRLVRRQIDLVSAVRDAIGAHNQEKHVRVFLINSLRRTHEDVEPAHALKASADISDNARVGRTELKPKRGASPHRLRRHVHLHGIRLMG